MRNVKSSLRFTMRRLGLIDEDSDFATSVWSDFIAAHSLKKQDTIVSFAKFCGVHGLSPADVGPETFAAFDSWLEVRTLCRNPRQTTNRVRGLWRRLAKADGTLTSPPSKRHGTGGNFILPLAAFPAAFQADLDALAAHLAGKTRHAYPDDDEAPLAAFRPLRPKTIEGRLGHARWAASALVASGVPIEDVTSLNCLVMPLEHAGAIIDVVAARYHGQPSTCANHIADVLRMIARHHAGLTARQVKQIVQWAAPYRRSYKGMTRKNERTVRDVLSPAHEQKLLHVADAAFQSAAKLFDKDPVTAARLAMRGLAVELLLHTQMRLQNLIGLEMDRHFHQTGPKGEGEMWINLAREEIKNKKALSYPLTDDLSHKVKLWVHVYRPVVAEPGSPFLFPGARSAEKAMTPQNMREAIKQVMRDYVGVEVTPHQFRHVAAQMALTENPGHYDEVRLMLGHANTQTTINSYAGIEGETAHRRFDELLRDRSRLLTSQSNLRGRK
jgi:integrase